MWNPISKKLKATLFELGHRRQTGEEDQESTTDLVSLSFGKKALFYKVPFQKVINPWLKPWPSWVGYHSFKKHLSVPGSQRRAKLEARPPPEVSRTAWSSNCSTEVLDSFSYSIWRRKCRLVPHWPYPPPIYQGSAVTCSRLQSTWENTNLKIKIKQNLNSHLL